MLKKVPFGLSSLAIAFSIFLSLTVVTRAQPITLRVALYPYVPDQYTVFMLLAREFQRQNEGVTLDLVEPVKEYYDGGLLALDFRRWSVTQGGGRVEHSPVDNRASPQRDRIGLAK